MTINTVRSGFFRIKATQAKGRPRMLVSPPLTLARVATVFDREPLKLLTCEQMLQRLPIALLQVKAAYKF